MILQRERLRDEGRAGQSNGLSHVMRHQHLTPQLTAVFQRRGLCWLVTVLAALAVGYSVVMVVMMMRMAGMMHLLRGMAARMGERAERREGHS